MSAVISWLIASRLGRAVGAAVAVLAAVAGVYGYGYLSGADEAKNKVRDADIKRADDIRETARETRKENEERNGTLSDDDIDQRLRDLRGR